MKTKRYDVYYGYNELRHYELTRRGIVNKFKRINPVTWNDTLVIVDGDEEWEGVGFFTQEEFDEIMSFPLSQKRGDYDDDEIMNRLNKLEEMVRNAKIIDEPSVETTTTNNTNDDDIVMMYRGYSIEYAHTPSCRKCFLISKDGVEMEGVLEQRTLKKAKKAIDALIEGNYAFTFSTRWAAKDFRNANYPQRLVVSRGNWFTVERQIETPQTYWENNGTHQNLVAKIDAAIKSIPQEEKGKSLIKYEQACIGYYDLFNNGLCNHAKTFRKAFGIAGTKIESYAQYEDLERRLDDIVLKAALELGIDTTESEEETEEEIDEFELSVDEQLQLQGYKRVSSAECGRIHLVYNPMSCEFDRVRVVRI